MLFIGLKPLVLTLLVLMAASLYVQGVSAAEPLHLKVSGKLTKPASPGKFPSFTRDQEQPPSSLLGKVNLFRGVLVDDGTAIQSSLVPSKTELTVSEAKPESAVKAIYGGLQISLQDNLSLVYTPGRLSKSNMNSDSQGLYLLTNRGGLGNWFIGVESNASSASADSGRSNNSAQVGVMFSLD